MHLSTLLKPAATALAGTGLVAASALGVHAAAPASAADSSQQHASSTQSCRPHGLRVRHAPEALRKDLKAARTGLRDSDSTGEAKRAERREARRQIRAGIADGKYGAKLQQRAERRHAAAAKRRAAQPEQLRADLAALRKLDAGAERRAAAAKIREARLDGTYGDAVQARAKKHQQHRQSCQEQREDRRDQRQDG